MVDVVLDNVTQLDVPKGFIDFLDLITKDAKRWGDNVAVTFQKTKVAKKLKKGSTTLDRYINLVKDHGVGSVEAKRGRNGGTVIVFDQNILNFKTVDNIVTSTSKSAEEIRDTVYPRSNKPEPKRRYRTKEKISADEMLLRAKNKEEAKFNDMLEPYNYPTKDLINTIDPSGRYYHAYIIAQMYSTYAVTFPYERIGRYTRMGDSKKVKVNEKALKFAKGYNVLSKRFIGTKNFNVFLKLYDMLKAKNIDPLAYLTVQFEYTSFLSENKKARQGAIPFVNFLISDKALELYEEQTLYMRRVRNNYNYLINTTDAVVIQGIKNPIIRLLDYAYRDIDYSLTDQEMSDRLATKIEEVELGYYTPRNVSDHMLNDSTERAQVMLGFYNDFLLDIKKSDIEEEHKDVLCSYMKAMVYHYIDPRPKQTVLSLMTFLTQIYNMRHIAIDIRKRSEEAYLENLGNLGQLRLYKQEDVDNFIKEGEIMDFALHSNGDKTVELFRTLGQALNIDYDINKVHDAIHAYGEEKIPLTVFGFLDLTQLYKKYGRSN